MNGVTVSQIAAALGVSVRAVQIKASPKRGNWTYTEEKVRGGRQRVYPVETLPADVREALAAASVHIESPAAQAGRVEAAKKKMADDQARNAALQSSGDGLARLATLTGKDRSRAEARLAILDALATFQRRSDRSATAAMHAFVGYYNDGAIDCADWIREHVSEVTASSLYNWRRKVREEGAARLSGNYGNRRGSGKIDSQREIREFAEAMVAEYPHLRPKALRRALTARFSDRSDIQLPGQSACERWLRRWKEQNKSLYLSIANPDAWNGKYRPAFGSASEDAVRINQRWELDSTPADLLLTDGRYHLVGCIDVFSRRVRLVVSKTSTATSVASVFRRAVLDWGVPESVKHDNGSDYRSTYIQRVWEFFDIEPLICDPYSGWQKPFIERIFGTFMRDLIEMAPGYCGHSVADRQAIEAQATFAKRLQDPDEVFDIRMNSEQLQEFCDRWISDIYEREVHSSLGCTPAEKAAGQRVRRVENERVLDVLLSQAPNGGVRTVGKKGIQVDGYEYIAAELADERVMGEPVQILLDEHDMGRVYCFADLGNGWEFLCIAECPEITGISRQAVAAEVRARNDRAVRDARNAMKRARKKHGTRDVVDDILDHARNNSDRVAHLPGRHDAAESAALTAASDAIAASDAKPEAPDTLDSEMREHKRAQIEAEEAEAARERSPKEQFRAWQEMVARTEPNDAERGDWRMYETSLTFRSRYELAYGEAFRGHGSGEPHEKDAIERPDEITPRREAK
ncbi:Mu transposase C-terminal domain-containing protein [Salinisphaera hydrothermalis]|uniref:Mu transposase C-terminal domain-containing protein n=1 Tax=Salinisphaera hydrothermalis TaxID=563188 RepID=UPI0033416441